MVNNDRVYGRRYYGIMRGGSKRRFLLTKKALIVHFLICELIFLPLFAYLLIYQGPFVKYRDEIVSTAMATNHERFFATWFLSTQEINRILADTGSEVKDAQQNVGEVQVAKTNSSGGTGQKDHIQIVDISGETFKGKLMIIPDPAKVELKLAPHIGEIGAPLSEFVNTYKAIGGINAGGFQDDNFLGTGAIPEGVVIQDGKIQYTQSGISKYSVIGFDDNNVLRISNAMSLDEIKSSNLRCAVSFGPALIINGQPLVVKGGATLQPRSAIGQRKGGTVLLLAIDGRQSDSKGANFMDVQDILYRYGAFNAANLDGGSSTTMNNQGKTVNNPCDITGERSIASAFLIMP